jgi:hypothetical protein
MPPSTSPPNDEEEESPVPINEHHRLAAIVPEDWGIGRMGSGGGD